MMHKNILLGGASAAAMTVAFSLLGADRAQAVTACTVNGAGMAIPYTAVSGDVIVCSSAVAAGGVIVNNTGADNVSFTAASGAGSVAAGGQPAVALGNNASLRVESGATLQGFIGKGTAWQSGTGLNAVILDGGTVSGTLAAGSGSTITVAGAMTTLAGNNITLTGDNNRLILNSTATFNNIVVGGTGGATNTVLELGGSTGTAFDTSTIGAAVRFQNFAKFEKTGSSVWTLTNAPLGFTPWTIKAGTLTIASDTALGTPTAGGTLTFDGGALNVTAGTTSIRAVAVASGGGQVTLAGGTTTSWGGVVSGSGNFLVNGGGTLKLQNAATYSGALTVASGTTLKLEDNGALTSANLVDNGTFDITAITANSTSLASLSGSGAVLIGTKSLTVTNGSGIYTGTMTGSGPITVTGGQLSVNGTSQSVVTVANGGTLKGIGTIGGFTISSGGIVAPGNSIGTLNVAGNTAFASGSIYQVEVDAAGNADKIKATGTAAISSGATVSVLAAAGSYSASTNYTIIDATGGVSGTFSSVTADLAFLQPSLTYTPTTVVLNLVNKTTSAGPVTFPSVAKTPNQIASAGALQALGSGSLYSAVLVSNTANALAAFDAASGEVHATLAASQFEAATNARRAVLEHMRRPSRAQGWSVWGSVSGDWGSISSDGNAAAANRHGVDLNIGADTDLDEHWRGGIEAGYNGSKLNVSARASSADITGGHVGAYAWGDYDGYVVRTGFSWGFGNADTMRTIAFTGFNDTATASQSTKTVLLYGEAGYDFKLEDVTIEPFAGIAWTQLNLGAFRETGGAAALTGTARDMDSGYFSMGVQANARAYDIGGATLTPMARAAWQTAFSRNTASRSLMFLSGTQAFTVFGTPLDGDRALVDVGATLGLGAVTQITLGYQGALGGRANDHAVRLMGQVAL